MIGPHEVSVVVCTRDRPALAAAAVASILRGNERPLEIVVVDQSTESAAGHSTPSGTSDVRVSHVRTPTRGLSRGRNLGARTAQGRVLAFVDDDVLVEPGWLVALTAALGERPEERVATGHVVGGAPETPDAFAPALSDPTLGRVVYRGRLMFDVLAGGNMAIERTVFERIGGFDERLGAGAAYSSAEDNDLGLRLLDAGLEIVHVREAVVVHRAWRPGRDYPLVRWRYGLGKGGFYAKHARNRGPYGLRRAMRDVGKRLVRAPVAVFRRPRYAAGELTYGAGVVVGMTRWLVRRGA